MPYFVPYIDSAGLHVNTYADIEAYYVQQAQSIFGSDIFLGNDSQDFQLIAAVANTEFNTEQALLLSYNARSPVTAIGTGLDLLVAINGVTREAASFSTVSVTLTGTALTVITNGVVADVNNNLWNLPNSVTLDGTGSLATTATAQVAGPISAQIGQVNAIYTPTNGWTGVTNTLPAVTGQSVETDSTLRSRQAASVANPSQALTTGILGSVLAVANVDTAVLYENDTSGTLNYVGTGYNPSGFPPHSITIVVKGGDGATIANTIAIRKTPGCYTNGDQTYTYTDQYGNQSTIRFYMASQQTIDVEVILTPLSGYNTTIATNLIAAVATYINNLAIGENVVISELIGAAVSVNTQQYPYFSVSALIAGIHPGALGSTDIVMNFNQQAISTITNVTIGILGAPAFIFNVNQNTEYIPLI